MNENAYVKFRLNQYIKDADPRAQLSVAVGTYRKMLSFTNRDKDNMHFFYRTANGKASETQ